MSATPLVDAIAKVIGDGGTVEFGVYAAGDSESGIYARVVNVDGSAATVTVGVLNPRGLADAVLVAIGERRS